MAKKVGGVNRKAAAKATGATLVWVASIVLLVKAPAWFALLLSGTAGLAFVWAIFYRAFRK